ncbi:YdeI/OmpD-associated family protein [Dyadobacter fanqingshengii]|uniref:YdeI/OmpD-associated family protein n=1 Tax=Dyadobacter fanqingshengii TaxID=2906443 RepID=A0A9X1PDS3_9BACT|nr:YdeI/OmpD-associated family protein [Dyadobacter fanqingshengii]MCF0042043.1 YdeI/OmpD-associated family protein [Dyadobacter fanqingshengii]USJ36254.1 YdeI/OmpD-associated family protein [Dyadobacter fanqingshengii]
MEDVVRFESTLDRLPRKGGEFYMIVPDEVAVQFVEGRKPARVRCLLNDKVDFQCAIRPKGEGGFYINIGTPLRQEGKFVLGQKLHVQIRKDESEFGRDMPEELQELLELDEEGKRLFYESLPSHQRAIIYYVAGAKSVQVRIDRAIMMINRLKVK